MKKKKILIFVIISILIVASIILISPSILNKSKGSLGEIVPANSAFDDINFYTCVVSSLPSNEENDMEIYSEIYDTYQGNLSKEKYYEKYNVNLTDEQLATITSLDCGGIRSTKGIEKLTSLNNLSIYYSSIKSINLSKNLNLSSLYIYNTDINSIDLSKNINLNNYSIYNNKLSSIVFPSKVSLNNNYVLKQNAYIKNIEFPGNVKMNINSDDIMIYNEQILIKKEMSLDELKKGLGLSNIDIKLYDSSNSSESSSTNVIDGMYVEFASGEKNIGKLKVNVFNNPYFDDYGLYQLIINSYNSVTGSSYTTKNNLTDEEFSKITSLSSYNSIFSTRGMEKLINLNSLNLRGSRNNFEQLNTLSKLSSLSLENFELGNTDISNLSMLEDLSLSDNNITSIKLPKNSTLSSIDLSDNKLKTLDVSGLIGLYGLMLDNNEIEEIKGLNELNNLYGISVVNNRLKKLDLSNMPNLEIYYISYNPCTISDVSIIKGDKIEYNPAFKLPPTVSLKTYNEYEDVISFNDGIITGLEVGESTISSFIPYDENVDISDIPIRYKVYVYDVLSGKYTVNKEHRYIYVGTENNDKAIKRYVKVYGEDANKEIEDNKFKLLRNNEVIEEFDIIKLSSSKYDLSSSVISYKGNFDIDSIDVINAKLQVIEDQLQVMYDDVIVKTFTLKEEK